MQGCPHGISYIHRIVYVIQLSGIWLLSNQAGVISMRTLVFIFQPNHMPEFMGRSIIDVRVI